MFTEFPPEVEALSAGHTAKLKAVEAAPGNLDAAGNLTAKGQREFDAVNTEAAIAYSQAWIAASRRIQRKAN